MLTKLNQNSVAAERSSLIGRRVVNSHTLSGRKTGGTIKTVSKTGRKIGILWDSTTTGHVSDCFYSSRLEQHTDGQYGRVYLEEAPAEAAQARQPAPMSSIPASIVVSGACKLSNPDCKDIADCMSRVPPAARLAPAQNPAPHGFGLEGITLLSFIQMAEHKRVLAVGQEIAIRVVRAMLERGYALSVDTEGDEVDICRSLDEAAILPHLFACDQAMLMVYAENDYLGWVKFIYGNGDGGTTVVSDYTTNLESLMAPIIKFAESLESR